MKFLQYEQSCCMYESAIERRPGKESRSLKGCRNVEGAELYLLSGLYGLQSLKLAGFHKLIKDAGLQHPTTTYGCASASKKDGLKNVQEMF